MQTLILVVVLQCGTRLASCNFSENELIAKFARVSTSLKLPGIQYRKVLYKSHGLCAFFSTFRAGFFTRQAYVLQLCNY